MTFLVPAAWSLVLLTVPIVVLYFFGLRRQRLDVAAGVLWKPTLAAQPFWIRHRRLASCVVHCALVVAMAATLAQPYWNFASMRPLVVILDTSASTKVLADGETRFLELRRRAAHLLSEKPKFQPVAIVSADSLVRLRCRFSTDEHRLLRSLQLVRPTDGISRINEAIEFSRSLRYEGRSPKIILFTDGLFPGASPSQDADDIEWSTFNGTTENVAITRLTVRPSFTDLIAYDVLVEVQNSGASTRVIDLLSWIDKEQESRKNEIPANTRRQFVHSYSPEEPVLLRYELASDDGLQADNVVETVLTPRDRTNVVLIGDSDPSIERVLRAIPGVGLTVRSEETRRVTESNQIFILDRPSKLPDDIKKAIILNPLGDSSLWSVRGQLAHPDNAIVSQQVNHPAIQGVFPERAVIRAAQDVDFLTAVDPLVVSRSGNVLLAEIRQDSRHLIISCLERRGSDLRSRLDWPLLLNRMLSHLASGRSFDGVVSTADVIRIHRPNKVNSRSDADLNAKEPPGVSPLPALLVDVGRRSLDSERQSAVMTDGKPSPADPFVSVNLLNREESDLTPESGLRLGDKDPKLEQGWSLWPLGGLICFLALISEWILFQLRRLH